MSQNTGSQLGFRIIFFADANMLCILCCRRPWCASRLQNGSEVLQSGLAGGPCAGILQPSSDACHRHRCFAQLSHCCGGEVSGLLQASLCASLACILYRVKSL